MAGDTMDGYLQRAIGLSGQNFTSGIGDLQKQALGDASGLYGRAQTGMDTLQGMASGQNQNDALNQSIQRQLDLGGGSYLNNILGSVGGMTNSGARQDLARRQNDYVADRLSQEYQGNQNRQLQAAQALPGMAGQLSNYALGVGGQGQALQNEQLRAPLQGLGILGDALNLGGARYGTESMGTSTNQSFSQGMNQQPGAPRQSTLGSLLGIAGTLGGAYLGGPAGASLGGSLGGLFGGGGGGSGFMGNASPYYGDPRQQVAQAGALGMFT